MISGYLISGIIVRALKRGNFSYVDFYVRRVNRILPALIVVLIATLVLGWAVLFSHEFVSLGKHVLAGATFVSNVALWNEAGYFDSQAKPLLHLWSLAVEEQFYLFWPFLFLVLTRNGRNLRGMIAAVVAGSFLISLSLLHFSFGSAAFYSPISRLWEIGAGGLLCIAEIESPAFAAWAGIHRKGSNIVAIAGLLLVGFSLSTVGSNTPWPGLWTLPVVSGTLMLIAAGPRAIVNDKLLSNRALVGIGLVSYPFYLWHWPLMVLSRLVNEGQLPRLFRLALIAVSLLLAIVTYWVIEMPIRFGERKRRSAVMLLVGLAATGIIGLLAMVHVINPRLSGELSRRASTAHQDNAVPSGNFIPGTQTIRLRVVPGDSTRSVVFIGDSHLAQYWPRIEQLALDARNKNPEAVLVTHEGCPSLPRVNRSGLSAEGAVYHCDKFFDRGLSQAAGLNVSTVVIGSFWENYLRPGSVTLTGDNHITLDQPAAIDSGFKMLESAIAGFRESGKTVYLILSNPVDPAFQPDSILLPRRLPGLAARHRRLAIPRQRVLDETIAVRARLMDIARRTGAVIVDPLETLCDKSNCPTVDLSGQPMYFDDNHMRPSFARMHATFIDRVFDAGSTPEPRHKSAIDVRPKR